jgi:hypothetical protein
MTIYLPPYYYGYGSANKIHSGSGDSISYVRHYEGSFVGHVSTLNQNGILNPGDSGNETTSTYSAMQIYIRAPAAGRLNIVATLECAESSYWGGLWDELGWSDANPIQSSQFIMWLIDNNPPDYDGAFHELLYDHRGGDDDEWSGIIAERGEIREYPFVTVRSYEAGQWLIVTAGIVDHQAVWVNDMDYLGEIRNSWLIKKLDVTAIP